MNSRKQNIKLPQYPV